MEKRKDHFSDWQLPSQTSFNKRGKKKGLRRCFKGTEPLLPRTAALGSGCGGWDCSSRGPIALSPPGGTGPDSHPDIGTGRLEPKALQPQQNWDPNPGALKLRKAVRSDCQVSQTGLRFGFQQKAVPSLPFVMPCIIPSSFFPPTFSFSWDKAEMLCIPSYLCHHSRARCPCYRGHKDSAQTAALWVSILGLYFRRKDLVPLPQRFPLPSPCPAGSLTPHTERCRALGSHSRSLQPWGWDPMLSVSNFVRGPPITLSALSSVTSPSHQERHRRLFHSPPFLFSCAHGCVFLDIFLMILHRSPKCCSGDLRLSAHPASQITASHPLHSPHPSPRRSSPWLQPRLKLVLSEP